jgi:pyruvate dehydrogenase E2 component (dihydrolipoamide acetyltransferase)
MARERGIELSALTGTGPDGRIVAEDVEKAVSAPSVAPAAPTGDIEVVQLTSVRKTIARRLTEAWEAPVFQLSVTADASELVATREQMVEHLREGETKQTVSDLLTRLVAGRHPPPRHNAQFVAADPCHQRRTPCGMTPNGLPSRYPRGRPEYPADRCRAFRSVTRARDGKLTQDLEAARSRLNLGMYGWSSVAVLNPPQVAILAVGSIDDRPLVVGGDLLIAPALTLTLTCDHRAIDGSEGAEFLRTVKVFLETPALAL